MSQHIKVGDLARENEPVALAMLMGFQKPKTFDRLTWSQRIVRGLPFDNAIATCNHIDPVGLHFRITDVVPPATYQRRKKDKGPLTKDASETLYGVARIYREALRQYGDFEAARAFLFRPHALLDNLAPIAVAKESSAGVEAVMAVLEGAEAGVAV